MFVKVFGRPLKLKWQKKFAAKQIQRIFSLQITFHKLLWCFSLPVSPIFCLSLFCSAVTSVLQPLLFCSIFYVVPFTLSDRKLKFNCIWQSTCSQSQSSCTVFICTFKFEFFLLETDSATDQIERWTEEGQQWKKILQLTTYGKTRKIQRNKQRHLKWGVNNKNKISIPQVTSGARNIIKIII